MALEQERALATDSKLLGVFHLLFNDWQPRTIHERYALAKPGVLKLVLRLEKLKLFMAPAAPHRAPRRGAERDGGARRVMPAAGRRQTIGMALGIRPYVVSWAMGLKPR